MTTEGDRTPGLTHEAARAQLEQTTAGIAQLEQRQQQLIGFVAACDKLVELDQAATAAKVAARAARKAERAAELEKPKRKPTKRGTA